MDGEMFLAWMEQGLVARSCTGDLVIMDNLATHKVIGVREAIEAGRSPAAVSAALFAGFQSHRKHVEQDQTNPAQPRSAHRGNCWPPPATPLTPFPSPTARASF